MDVRQKTTELDATALKTVGNDGASLGEGIAAEFTAVVTTKSVDRDGDILEPDGATLDQSMALLWQHDANMPIGKFVGTVQRDSERIVGRYQVADTALGRDAAKLLKLGVLRLSHGFRPDPKAVDPIKGTNGFHIRKFEIVETSLVSIPANPDAAILSLTTKSLSFESQPVKAWVESITKGKNMTTLTTPPVGGFDIEAIKSAVKAGMLEGFAEITKAGASATADGQGSGQKSTTMADMLKANAAGANGGNVRVKSVAERYSSETKSLKHFKTGESIVDGFGRKPQSVSELNAAKHGALVKRLGQKAGVSVAMTEEDRSLLDLTFDGDWVGNYGGEEGVKVSSEIMKKDLLSDSVSGGTNAVPFAFDVDVITFPLLMGELLPYVDLKTLGRGNSVHAISLATPTVTWGAQEGTEMPIFDTSSMIEPINTSIYDVVVSILIGRHFLDDSPADIGAYVTRTIGERFASQLDAVIATGNGSTQPLGIINASSLASVTCDNTTTGPPTLNDYQQLLFSVPKQYRTQANRCAYLSNDVTYGRSRTEMRTDPHPLTGGGTTTINLTPLLGIGAVNSYMTMEWPHRINPTVGNSTIIFGAMAKYRLYRRLGMELRVVTEGLDLARRNEIAIVARARYGGQVVDANAFAMTTDAQS